MTNTPCPRTEVEATLQAAGELAGLRKQAFLRHLRRCGECARAVQEMSEGLEQLARLPVPRLSPLASRRLHALAGQVLETSDPRGVMSRRRSPRIRRLILVSSAIVTLFGLYIGSLELSAPGPDRPVNRHGLTSWHAAGPSVRQVERRLRALSVDNDLVDHVSGSSAFRSAEMRAAWPVLSREDLMLAGMWFELRRLDSPAPVGGWTANGT